LFWLFGGGREEGGASAGGVVAGEEGERVWEGSLKKKDQTRLLSGFDWG